MKAAFEREGHYCVTVCDGLDAVDAIVEADFDLAVLGLGLTGIDSIQLLEYIRTLDIPTIMVLDASQEKECLHCMEIGASACIIKPFSVRELLSCANKFLERGALRETLRMGTTEIDTTARQVRIAGCEVVLSPKEYDLLMLFVRNPHRAFSREDIYERVWHGYYPSKSKAVDYSRCAFTEKDGLGRGDQGHPQIRLPIRSAIYGLIRHLSSHHLAFSLRDYRDSRVRVVASLLEWGILATNVSEGEMRAHGNDERAA